MPGKYRKLRDKYDREVALAQHEMKCGNKSKYDGNISSLYAKIKQAIDEEEAHGESLKEKVLQI